MYKTCCSICRASIQSYFIDLRHTHATLRLTMGVSPKVAQQRLGHGSISTTMDIYSHE
ncbi:tyrosine-type recombinase/integrase [Vallitalea pronyensis]|uniref:Tyrosine-type recombinase/integrase n=1 Tax=Vallitalea pronyensis TaxID=1348613 RepID=A0A8J8SJG4_9FIRM|nr:tyrosine-type recombinase/integrase [Vallitalea pronyensis]